MSRKKILLVDDSSTVILMERMILTKNGFDLVVANDGVAGVEKAKVEQPDLILLDVVMPRMNGIEALRTLRETKETSQIPVIMVTTRSEAANVEASFASGCTDYVTKPINGVELLTKIRTYIGD